MKQKNFQRGQSLVELLVAIAISMLIVPALLTGLVASQDGKAQLAQRSQGILLLKETDEAIRNIRENGWTTFAINGTYHPQKSGSTWILANGSETINGITRSIVIGDVQRDANGNIVSSGGTIDPSTKSVITTVSWTLPRVSSMQSTAFLTRYRNNLTYVQTTQADFNAGVNNGTAVVATTGTGIPNDGQIQLGSGGGGNWCNPGSSVVATYDLPGQGVVQAISATTSATQDVAYTTTGGNSSGDAVDGLTISHASPPIVANPSKNTEAKAYGIFVDNAGSYVYFNENNPPNHTVRIAKASDLSDLGFFDVTHGSGTSIYVSGNTGYTIVGDMLYSFDVSSKNGSRPQLGSVELSGTGKRVVVVGTNAYVATSSTDNQLQIINVSDPTEMNVTKSVDLENNQGAVDVYVNNTQTYAYIATNYSPGSNDFFIVDLKNTENIYGYVTKNGMNPKGITVVPGNKAILVGSGGELYQVFDVTTPSAATHCGGMSPSGVTSINAISSVTQTNGNAFSYILTNNASAEFQIVAGGPGGQFATSGIFESSTFDPGYQTAFNRFVATINQPSSTTIKMQVAAASAINNSCSGVTFTYLGPNGNPSTYFTPIATSISGQIPFGNYNPSYQNPARCFRYKAWLSTSDFTQTPILYDMTVNYSP